MICVRRRTDLQAYLPETTIRLQGNLREVHAFGVACRHNALGGGTVNTAVYHSEENAMSHANVQWIADELARLKDEGLLANIRTIESPMGAWVTIGGRPMLNFCANNYLGLASDPRIRDAAKRAIDAYGVGPGAVRTIAGTMDLHVELERKLAAFKRAEACITFQSGFTANLATIPALMGKGDVIFSDELNHASIIDACRLSRATTVRYAHGDVDDLRRKIDETHEYGRRLIVTDGVFSMDGDLAPLDQLCELAEAHDILLMVDDAHGEGVLGEGGRGIVDHFGLHGRVQIEVGTLSKAFGVVGGLVAGDRTIIEWLRQRGRPFLFSSAMTVPDVAACSAAVDILQSSTELVDRLWANARVFRGGMEALGFDTGHSETPIVPVMLGDAGLAQRFSRRLFDKGVFAMAIAYPTVPLGKARIRVMNSAAHSNQDLEQALGVFDEVGRELGVI
jgi:glycine C-acetyltransferase